MSYTIEIYKKKQKPEKNFLTYALYVMFFPQLVAGPIERPQHLIPQLHKAYGFDYRRVTDGLKMITWGFFLKLVIADRLAAYVDPIFNNSPLAQSGTSFFIATILFSYQIYCDFLGYSTIAVGAAKVLGFTLMNNFDNPYFSRSPIEFWRKWHISLSSWMRDYIYIPLGGNRVPLYLFPFTILATFLLSGLWHGANWTFIIWGLLHGSYIIAYRLLGKMFKPMLFFSYLTRMRIFSVLQVVITFCLVTFAWIFFRARTVQEGVYIATHLHKGMDTYIGSIVLDATTQHVIPVKTILQPILITREASDLLIGITAIIIMETIYFFQKGTDIWQSLSKRPVYVRWSFYILLLWSVLIFGEFAKKQFIYFAF